MLLPVLGLAQNKREYVGYNETKNTIYIQTNEGRYIITPYSNEIIETAFYPEGVNSFVNSHAVKLDSLSTNFIVQEYDDKLIIETKTIHVHVHKKPFEIQYFNGEQLLITEMNGFTREQNKNSLNLGIDSTEVLYGGGARALGMNRRGNRLELYNKAHYGYTTHSDLMNYSIPLVISSKKYAVHFDNPQIGFLDLDSKNNNTITYESIGGRMVYQVITGNDWNDLIQNYTFLTGRQTMPPRWVFGNFSSRFGYHSEAETRKTVQKFITDSIPLDAVIIDIYWFGKDIKGHMGNLEFYTDSFPTPYKMIDDFRQNGVKTVLVTEPFVLTTSKRWDEVVKQNILATDSVGKPCTYDFYFGNTGLIDLFKPEAKNWFWNIYKELTENGVGGWWGDLGEPEVHPSDLYHMNGKADEVHNIYGHNWAKLIYEGYQKDFPNQRPFILMRAGYSGSQRYGLIPWSGDVSRSWGGLQSQPEIALQMGMQGLAYMHSDLGGFAGGEEFDAELYMRWLQYGVFQPVFRPHAQEHMASEPVFHDTNTKDLARMAINLRYKMLPYNYTLAFKNSRSGLPFMKPIWFEDSSNDTLYTYSKGYLWGDNFYVVPVLESGLTKMDIYFPNTSDWVDYYTGKIYEGGKTNSVNLSEEYIPTFVRNGSIITLSKLFQNTDLYISKELALHYYFNPMVENDSAILYHDDGITPNSFEKNKYEILEFNYQLSDGKITFNCSSNIGDQFASSDRIITLYIHNLEENIKNIEINGKELDYLNKNKVLQVSFNWNSAEALDINIIK